MATIYGTSGDDTLNGTSSADTIYGYGGNDTLNGGNGNDRLDGGTGADTMVGGLGNDIYWVDDSGDVVTEANAQGADQVRTTLANYLLADFVEKLMFIGSGSFTGTGNDLNNEIIGGGSGDTLDGGDGHDTIWGGGGIDTLYGGAGSDLLSGDSGADYMEGGADNDSYIVDDVGDTVYEQSGGGTGDEVLVSLSEYVLPDEVENASYNGWSGDFTVVGNTLDNVLIAGSGNDFLIGDAGNDTLRGNSGNDILIGGDGDDLLVGGAGADYYDGEAGIDTFSIGPYQAGVGSDADTISGFEQGTDKIDLSYWDTDMFTAGDQAFSFIGTAAFTYGITGQLRYGAAGSDTVIEGDINGDAVADFQIVLTGAYTVVANDFLL